MLSSPSSAIMASDSRRPYSIGIEGVYGKYPVAFALIMSPKSKKTRGHLACSRAADGADIARHAGCRLVVDDEDPFDLVLRVLRQDLPDAVGWRALAPLDIDDVHAQAMPLGEIDPQVAELAVPRREHPIARRERVDQRCLPPAGAGRGEDERLPRRRLEGFPEIAEQAGGQLGERRGAVVLHRAVHGAEDSLGYVRGAGDEQEIAAGHKKRPQREGKNTASGLRYSATSVPQPLGWVGASPPKLRGANSLAPFQLCLSYRRRATGIGAGADTDPHAHSSESVRADRRRRHSSTPRSTRAAGDVDRRLNAPVPAHGLQLLPVDRSWRRYRNARRHHFGARTYSASLFPAARGNKLERR